MEVTFKDALMGAILIELIMFIWLIGVLSKSNHRRAGIKGYYRRSKL